MDFMGRFHEGGTKVFLDYLDSDVLADAQLGQRRQHRLQCGEQGFLFRIERDPPGSAPEPSGGAKVRRTEPKLSLRATSKRTGPTLQPKPWASSKLSA